MPLGLLFPTWNHLLFGLLQRRRPVEGSMGDRDVAFESPSIASHSTKAPTRRMPPPAAARRCDPGGRAGAADGAAEVEVDGVAAETGDADGPPSSTCSAWSGPRSTPGHGHERGGAASAAAPATCAAGRCPRPSLPLSGKLMEDPVVLRGDGVAYSLEAIKAFLASHPLSAWDAVAGWTRQLLDASLGPAAAPPPSRSHSPPRPPPRGRSPRARRIRRACRGIETSEGAR